MTTQTRHGFIAEHDLLQIPTPDVAARREHLLFTAEGAELCDPLHIENALKRYAAVDLTTAEPLFRELAAMAAAFIELNEGQPTIGLTGFLGKDEALDMYASRIEELLAELVPSPAVYTGTADDATASINKATAEVAA